MATSVQQPFDRQIEVNGLPITKSNMDVVCDQLKILIEQQTTWLCPNEPALALDSGILTLHASELSESFKASGEVPGPIKNACEGIYANKVGYFITVSLGVLLSTALLISTLCLPVLGIIGVVLGVLMIGMLSFGLYAINREESDREHIQNLLKDLKWIHEINPEEYLELTQVVAKADHAEFKAKTHALLKKIQEEDGHFTQEQLSKLDFWVDNGRLDTVYEEALKE